MARRKRKKSTNTQSEFVSFLTLVWYFFVVAAIYYLVKHPAYVLILICIAIIWFIIKHKYSHELKIRQTQELENHILRRHRNDFQNLDPYELESHVASVINALDGWNAETTKGSGDQGADVVAIGPSSKRVVIQVKHQQATVTNKGVQEVVASKPIYQATDAVVFTSGPGYTQSAIELAKANRVRLWQVDDLINLQKHAQNKTLPSSDILPH